MRTGVAAGSPSSDMGQRRPYLLEGWIAHLFLVGNRRGHQDFPLIIWSATGFSASGRPIRSST